MVETKRDLSIFAHNVLWLRKQNKLSKSKMASILGIGVASLNKVEKGILPPRMNVEVVFNIYDTFGIHPQDLFGKKL